MGMATPAVTDVHISKKQVPTHVETQESTHDNEGKENERKSTWLNRIIQL